ncbi:hypothetical protein FHT40_004594 [Mycolicibacterium sp. BK556]|uniref:hypothetical protein n=1 Tax=Mycobacteriaceae TaxID=1762 RepID=UPI001061E71F|nr:MULTISPECIES: hypothetical protein [Mycobacteriaceae]MBB3604910.1 hypothetical protein [Mycolicibacterium sp. BK556]MBB3635106.1 hypothetical protein [Mycolicibacterium sp. BK607]MBB3748099.1 hypothetical protein [Mycolicibacterium sp. BK634]
MKITRTLTTAAVLAASAALGFAASAVGDPGSITGTYAVRGGDDGAVVTAASSCVPVVNGCTANLTSTVGWTSVATYTDGRWNFTVTKPDGIVCDNGSYAPVRIAYSVDAATMNGTITADSNGDCPGGQITQAPFQLVKVG